MLSWLHGENRKHCLSCYDINIFTNHIISTLSMRGIYGNNHGWFWSNWNKLADCSSTLCMRIKNNKRHKIRHDHKMFFGLLIHTGKYVDQSFRWYIPFSHMLLRYCIENNMLRATWSFPPSLLKMIFQFGNTVVYNLGSIL